MRNRMSWPNCPRCSLMRKSLDGRTSMGETPRTGQQRSWLVNKIRTDIAMIGTKLNAQVIIKNLQNMHSKSLPPTGARGRNLGLTQPGRARVSGLGPPARQGTTYGRTQRPPSGVADVVGPARDPWINWVDCRQGCSQSVNMLSTSEPRVFL